VSLIFDHIPNEPKTLHECALVNKQFHVMAIPRLWKVLDFDFNNIKADHFLACVAATSPQRLSMLGRHVRELGLHWHGWTDQHFARFVRHLPLLERVTFGDSTGITDRGFRYLPRHCTHLTALDLTGIELSDDAFTAIGQHCHQLRHLTCSMWGTPSTKAWESLTPCPLESLDFMCEYPPLSQKGMTCLKSFHHLTSLSIDQNVLSPHKISLTRSEPPLDTSQVTTKGFFHHYRHAYHCTDPLASNDQTSYLSVQTIE
jgi:hypothetical protein